MQKKLMKASEDGFEKQFWSVRWRKNKQIISLKHLLISHELRLTSYLTYISLPLLMLVGLISGWYVHSGKWVSKRFMMSLINTLCHRSNKPQTRWVCWVSCLQSCQTKMTECAYAHLPIEFHLEKLNTI